MLGERVTKSMVLQGQFVDEPNKGGNVGTELLKFSVLVVNRHLQLRDGYAEACFVFGGAAALFDALVELVFQVGVSLSQGAAADGECVSR